jgi:excisionase family DNA binding protein
MPKMVDGSFYPLGKSENMNALMTTKDAANFWGVSMRTVFRWIRDGRLKPLRKGKTVRFKRSDVERADEPREPHDPTIG